MTEPAHYFAGTRSVVVTWKTASQVKLEAAAAYELPIALPGSTFPLEFGDVRDDRVVLYGPAAAEMEELRYVIKATNVGTYTVPPVQARALYDNTVFARGQAGKLVVVPR